MYNQFILEELKTLSDLLNTGAISQEEFDHLKQILIDGTRTAAAAEHEGSFDNTTNNPEEAVKQYMNEAKTLLLYRQFDKAYSLLQKVLVLRPEHKEANRLRREVKSQFFKDYLVGGLLGIGLACGLSYLITVENDVNFVLLCIVPVLLGLLLPKLISRIFVGRIGRPISRYATAGAFVALFSLTLNVLLANTLVQAEQMILKPDAPIATVGPVAEGPAAENPVNDTENSVGNDADTNETPSETLTSSGSTQTNPEITPEVTVEETPDSTKTEMPVVNNQEFIIRNILKHYYRDFNSHKFDASKYFAPKVDRFITLRNTTPEEINNVINNEFYPEFEGAVSSIAPKSLSITRLPNGSYQADFEETMNCYRKSKEQHQYIRTKVKVVFDRNMKIKFNYQETILEKKFGLKAGNETGGKVIYTRQ